MNPTSLQHVTPRESRRQGHLQSGLGDIYCRKELEHGIMANTSPGGQHFHREPEHEIIIIVNRYPSDTNFGPGPP